MNINREHLRQGILVTTDSVIIVLSFVLALQLAGRDVADVHYRWYEYAWMIAVLLGVKLVIFQTTGFYREIVRYASIEFALKVVKSTVFGSLIAITMIHLVRREIEMPVLVVDWMASCILIGLTRFGWRYIKEGRLSRTAGSNTLLYGAGEHGAALARHIRRNDDLGCRIVGFIDDSAEKSGKSIEGVPVVGTLSELSRVIQEHAIQELVVSFANPDGEVMKRIFRVCREHGVRCRIVPGMTDVISGTEAVRNVDLSDLMRRPRRSLDREMVAGFLRGRRVLITGAAGSIGSEIFRQVLSFEPAALAAIDHSEFGLYQLDEEFADHPLKARCFYSLVDVKCQGLVEDAFSSFEPDVVFHAAAYKHVPILEQDVKQAVRNNVEGLLNVIHVAERHAVSKFVFISTDKAVRPTNVMGATKRIGERIVHAVNGRRGMQCVGVRFGNVLASSGSVVPKFITQIKAGGPVTVTHPEVTRYFMLIPEAVELVLQAGSLGEGGEIFVLDMGKPVRIREMAEDLISLMGHVPHTGIPIVYTGLRPGEKLHEELFLGDIEKATRFKDISIGKVEVVAAEEFELQLAELLSAARSSADQTRMRGIIRKMVPEFKDEADAMVQQAVDVELPVSMQPGERPDLAQVLAPD